MNANTKILNILLDEMGAEAVIAFCQTRLAASRPPSSPAPAPAPLQNTVITPPSAPAKTDAPPKAPIKIVGKKVVVKKPADAPAVVKNLSAELTAASTEPKWICPPCGKGPGNDHRPCVFQAFDCDVAAWETAVGLRKPSSAPTVKPAAVVAETTTEPKKTGRPKKVAVEPPRCDARIYGEQVEMTGTKAPNGKPLHCFRPAQCERKSHDTLAVPESGDPRILKDGETVAEDEGKFHLCKLCVKRWDGRAENAANWHGFFDDNGAPDTSHFINGAWYTKKMAAVKPADEDASGSDSDSDGSAD